MTTPTGNQATVDSGIWQMRTITRGATDRITKYPTPSIGMNFAYDQGVHVLLTATNGGGTWKHRPGRAADRPFLRQIRTPQPKPGRSKATNGPTMPKRHLNALGFVSIGGVSAENDTNCSRRRFDAEWPTAALLSPRAHPRAQTRPNQGHHRNRKVKIDPFISLQYLRRRHIGRRGRPRGCRPSRRTNAPGRAGGRCLRRHRPGPPR